MIAPPALPLALLPVHEVSQHRIQRLLGGAAGAHLRSNCRANAAPQSLEAALTGRLLLLLSLLLSLPFLPLPVLLHTLPLLVFPLLCSC